jgi:diguanylate cyclase (GGDEF)-like protein/putative nucleotidyltransferase with HDIG domain
MVDLDNFKQVNDTSGHLEGDLILARVGRQIERRCRQSNVVARYGGDEFVVLMPETGVEQAVVLADRLRRMLAGDPVLSKQAVTASLGVAVFPLHGFTGGEILRSADAAMYSAKNSGGNRVVRAADVGENDSAAARRHLVSSYVDDFLKQEQVTHEDVERLVTRLQAFEGGSPEETDQFLLDAVEMLNHAAEARESLGADHAHEVERYATMIGREIGLDMDTMADLSLAARFHDVGKVFVPESILGKPGMLSEEEFDVVKQHPAVGAEILQVMPESERLCETVRHHHESFDGTGYPDALSGEAIPVTSRVLAVADAFANMLSDRPFAAAKTVAQAVAELERMSGTRFDPKLAAILARHMESESSLSNITPQRT